jgi:hypothetical protein
MSRILWVAIAEGRGHLMRAHLARRTLADAGIEVEVATTREDGRQFLAALGCPSLLLPGGPAGLCYDGLQNLDRAASERAILARLPRAAWADLGWLRARADRWALVVDDAFHPSLVLAPFVISSRTLPIVHVHAEHLRSVIGGVVDLAAQRAFATLEISSKGALPPLVSLPKSTGPKSIAAVYLNSYFTDPRLGDAIEGALAAHALPGHLVGYRDRPGWRSVDPQLAEALGRARVLIAAPGLATATQVAQLGIPFVGLLSEQPEQRANWARLVETAPGPLAAVELSGPDLRAQIERALSWVSSAPTRVGRPQDPAPLWRSTWSELVTMAHCRRARKAKPAASCKGAKIGGPAWPDRHPRSGEGVKRWKRA